MEIYNIQRPSALPAALAPMSAVRATLTVDAPQRSQAHQVLAQLALVKTPASVDGNRTTGFTGNGTPSSDKRMDVSGVPPRGRPV